MRPLVLERVVRRTRATTGQKGSCRTIISAWTSSSPVSESQSGRLGGCLRADVLKLVMDSAQDPPGDRDTGTLDADALFGREVVGVIGKGYSPGGTGCLIERPAQHRRPLAGEVTTGALSVRVLNAYVESDEADRLARTGKATAVPELGEDRHGEDLADPPLAHQHLTARKSTGKRDEHRVDAVEFRVNVVDAAQGDLDNLTGCSRKLGLVQIRPSGRGSK